MTGSANAVSFLATKPASAILAGHVYVTGRAEISANFVGNVDHVNCLIWTKLFILYFH